MKKSSSPIQEQMPESYQQQWQKRSTRNLNGLMQYEPAKPYLQDIVKFGSHKGWRRPDMSTTNRSQTTMRSSRPDKGHGSTKRTSESVTEGVRCDRKTILKHLLSTGCLSESIDRDEDQRRIHSSQALKYWQKKAI